MQEDPNKEEAKLGELFLAAAKPGEACQATVEAGEGMVVVEPS